MRGGVWACVCAGGRGEGIGGHRQGRPTAAPAPRSRLLQLLPSASCPLRFAAPLPSPSSCVQPCAIPRAGCFCQLLRTPCPCCIPCPAADRLRARPPLSVMMVVSSSPPSPLCLFSHTQPRNLLPLPPPLRYTPTLRGPPSPDGRRDARHGAARPCVQLPDGQPGAARSAHARRAQLGLQLRHGARGRPTRVGQRDVGARRQQGDGGGGAHVRVGGWVGG